MILKFSIALIVILLCARPAQADCILKSLNETRKEGVIVYNKDFDVLQVCTGTKWRALGKLKPKDKPACNPANLMPGCLSADGSIYAGKSPDGDRPMFVTRCDYGQNWDGFKCAGIRLLRPWGGGIGSNPAVNAHHIFSGSTNTDMLINADSNPDEDGQQPYMAAQACADLNIHSKTDWYLPARDELLIISHHHEEIENFQIGAWYYTSNGAGGAGRVIIMGSDGTTTINLNSSLPIRCARKD